MNLKIYDNTCVRIVDTDGNAFDGLPQLVRMEVTPW